MTQPTLFTEPEVALFADVPNRTLRALLLPFNELSSPTVSGTEPVMFSRGVVELPSDPSIITGNLNHSQFAPVARATVIEETDRGVVATFAVANTAEGNQLLADATNPDTNKRPKVSAEVRGLVRDGVRAIKAVLTGAAFVPQGAFASAALFSIAPDEADTIKAAVDAAVSEALAKLTTQPPVAAPANPTGDTMTAAAAPAAIPAGLNQPTTTSSDKTTMNGLFAALAYAGSSKDRSVLEPFSKGSDALFAISTIQQSGPGGVTIGADTQVPQFLQELWTRRPYERRFLPLFNHADLTSMKVIGWTWDPTKEPAVAAYSGNTGEIPSNAIDTIPVSIDAERIAGGHKLDRRYIDFGDTSVYASYFAKMTESYSRVTDLNVLATAVAGATTMDADTVPDGIAAGLAAVVDGALAVIASENSPSFAVVSPELWRDIALTSKNDVLGYLSASMGLEGGDLAGFRIIPGPVGTGLVLVGAKESYTVHELGGVPIRVEGLDPHHGAVDPALFGYLAKVPNNAAALALVDTDPA
jgi:hypothetical protein